MGFYVNLPEFRLKKKKIQILFLSALEYYIFQKKILSKKKISDKKNNSIRLSELGESIKSEDSGGFSFQLFGWDKSAPAV